MEADGIDGILMAQNLQGHVWDETLNSYGNDTGAGHKKRDQANGTGEIRVDSFLREFLWKSILKELQYFNI